MRNTLPRSTRTRASDLADRSGSQSPAQERPGRISGATVPFGAPGPRLDLLEFLDLAHDRATIDGGEVAAVDRRHHPGAPATNYRQKRVDLPDGTRISFLSASDLLEAD